MSCWGLFAIGFASLYPVSDWNVLVDPCRYECCDVYCVPRWDVFGGDWSVEQCRLSAVPAKLVQSWRWRDLDLGVRVVSGQLMEQCWITASTGVRVFRRFFRP